VNNVNFLNFSLVEQTNKQTNKQKMLKTTHDQSSSSQTPPPPPTESNALLNTSFDTGEEFEEPQRKKKAPSSIGSPSTSSPLPRHQSSQSLNHNRRHYSQLKNVLANGMKDKMSKDSTNNGQSPAASPMSAVLAALPLLNQQQQQQQAPNQTFNSLLNNGQTNANSMAAAALFAGVTSGTSAESVNCLLLRHLTEILGNQLIMSRKFDSILDGIDSLNHRMQAIETHIFANGGTFQNEQLNDTVSNADDNDEQNEPSRRSHSDIRLENAHDDAMHSNDVSNEMSPLSHDQYTDMFTTFRHQQHQPNYGAQNLTARMNCSMINENDLKIDKDMEDVLSKDVIKRCLRKAKHRGNFAANLAAELFTKDERINGNCTGTRGKRQLSPKRLQLVKDITFQIYSCQSAHEVEEFWRKECITAIDAKNRSIGRDTTTGMNNRNSSNSSASTPQNLPSEPFTR